ncbi:MAG: alpha/beta fold hydrolase [Solirubrobacterales bacterium]
MEASEPRVAYVTSADGSRIGYEVVGEGPPLVVVHGTAADRTQWGPIRDGLAERFTVYLADRRGRGLSLEEGDGTYSLDRESEDISALVAEVGVPPYVFGHGFGGICVLKAAADGVEFHAILLDDGPTGRPGPPQVPDDVADRMEAPMEAGDPDGALEVFLREVVGLNEEQVAGVRGTEMWQTRVGTVHTTLRETRCAGAYRRETEKLAGVEAPVRFVVGTESTEPMREAAAAAHADMPQSELVTLDGRLFTSMYADPDATAREIGDWFLSKWARGQRSTTGNSR